MNTPVWLFDLDNTLHNADAGIFLLINHAMTDYLAGRLNLSTTKRPPSAKTIGIATARLWPDCKSTILKSTLPNFWPKAIPCRKF